MKEINVTIIGSGSTYTPELMDGFLKRKDSLTLKRVTFMDIDERKRTIVGNLCTRILRNDGCDCEIVYTDSLKEAITGADFVLTQFRVGKLPARYLDENIPIKYNLIGQETTGIGGFFKALRTIPVMQEIASAIEAYSPNAWLINFTNPSGIITEYLANYTRVKQVGLCNVPISMYDDIYESVGKDVKIMYLGLNHLSWVTSVKRGSTELIHNLIANGLTTKVMANIHDDKIPMECLADIKALPSSYLQYYYNKNTKLNQQKIEKKCRAQVCMEIEEKLLELYQDKNLVTKPALLDKRGGHKYSYVAVSLIDAIANDKKEVHVVNCKNNNALSFMSQDDVVEIEAIVDADGIHPIPIENFDNPHIITLMQVIKQYEKLTVKAALTGDESLARNALLLHPLVGDFYAVSECFEEMKCAHSSYLTQFYPH
jgi:6-phospho-beta-glucosidase|nr:6-phospho-beta-glucosidase [uncultured Lachnoclostridium sp.]